MRYLDEKKIQRISTFEMFSLHERLTVRCAQDACLYWFFFFFCVCLQITFQQENWLKYKNFIDTSRWRILSIWWIRDDIFRFQFLRVDVRNTWWIINNKCYYFFLSISNVKITYFCLAEMRNPGTYVLVGPLPHPPIKTRSRSNV